jgi:hypothetical protein
MASDGHLMGDNLAVAMEIRNGFKNGMDSVVSTDGVLVPPGEPDGGRAETT